MAVPAAVTVATAAVPAVTPATVRAAVAAALAAAVRAAAERRDNTEVSRASRLRQPAAGCRWLLSFFQKVLNENLGKLLVYKDYASI